MKVCSVPGCPRIYDDKVSKCPEHRREARRARVDNKVYSSPGHLRFRGAVLARDYICVIDGCFQFATVADHYPHTRRELADSGLDPNDPVYGRGLCAPHHNKHTAATSPGGWAAFL